MAVSAVMSVDQTLRAQAAAPFNSVPGSDDIFQMALLSKLHPFALHFSPHLSVIKITSTIFSHPMLLFLLGVYI